MGAAAVALALAALAGCGSDSVERLSDADLQRVTDELTTDVFYGKGLASGEQPFVVPAAAITLDYGEGEPQTALSGVSSLSDRAPLQPDQVQSVGSSTKTVTATLVMGQVEDGQIDLDQTVPEIAADHDGDGGTLAALARKFDSKLRDVTLRNLLNHTSGLQSWDETTAWAEAFAADPLTVFTLEQLARFGLESPVLFKPGQKGKWNYSNTDTILAGMVLEAVTGQTVAEQMQGLFDELGMDSSFYSPDPAEAKAEPLDSLVISGYVPLPPPGETEPALLTKAFSKGSTQDALGEHPAAIESVSTNPKAAGATVKVKPASKKQEAQARSEEPIRYKDVTHTVNIGMGLSAGGLVSNTADMARFWRALFDGEIVNEDTLALMTENTVPLDEAPQKGVKETWGLGMDLQVIEPGVLFKGSPAYRVYGKAGNWFGYSANNYYVEDLDLVVANTVDIFPQPVGDLGALANVLEAYEKTRGDAG